MIHRLLLILVSAVVLAGPSHSETLLFDDFDGPSLDLAVWRLPTGPGTFFGRTQIKPPSEAPIVSGGSVVLQLDTFNPTALIPGDSFWGQEIQTLQSFPLGTGLSIKSRMRYLGPPPGGLVAGFFSFGLNFPIRDEIDFELLSNDLGDEMLFTNVFDDDDFSAPGDFVHASVVGLDPTQFTLYEIRWLPDRVQWYVDALLIREELATLPDDASEIRLNIWAPDEFFVQAFDAALQPATTAGTNQEYEIEIDFVSVTVVPEPTRPILLGVGLALVGLLRLRRHGTGLPAAREAGPAGARRSLSTRA
jgi:hypothetical protein